MADQTQRLEIATVRAEVGSNIVFRFANDAANADSIPTQSGDIQNLKQVVLEIQQDAAEKISISTTIYPTVAAGLTATVDQEIFLVQSDDENEIYTVWKNDAGSAVSTGKTALSATAIQTALDASNEAAQAAEEAADIATSRTAGFLTPSSTPPEFRDNGLPLQAGDRYFNTADQSEYIYKDSGWGANDSLEAVRDLEESLSGSSGSAIVGYETLTVEKILDQSLPLANYAALRNYSGRASGVRITQSGIAGLFQRLVPGTYTDDGGLTIVDALGRGWRRIYTGAVSSSWFQAVGDGITDDTIALNAWANCGQKLLFWGEGKYRVTPANGVDLSVAEFSFGDASLRACIKIPAGVTIITAGTATELVVDVPTATTCGIAISADVGGSPASHSQITTTIQRFMLRANGGDGRYGIITPANSSILYNKRPRHDLDVHFAPPPDLDANTIAAYGWEAGIIIGDCVDAKINYSGYGTYNATLANTGQRQMVGCRVQATNGAYGLSVRFQCSNMYKFFDAPKSLEGFVISQSEGLGCWIGLSIYSESGNPGGYIDTVHINTNNIGYDIRNRSSLHIGMVEAYRSDGFHAHGGAWTGVSLTNCPKVTIGSIHAIPGTSFAKMDSVLLRADNSTFVLKSYQGEYLNSIVKAANCKQSETGTGVINVTDTVHDLSGSSMLDYIGGDVLRRSGTSSYFKTDGLVDKKRLRFPLNSMLTVRTQQEITISAAGTLTVRPRESATNISIVMSAGTGSFTYDVLLDRTAAIPGDVVKIKVVGSSSTNPTVRILDGSTSVILSSFSNITGTKRIVGEYVFKESGTWAESYLIDSVESQY